MTETIAAKLASYTWRGSPPIPGFTGKAAMSGKMGSVVFVMTEDHDGQIEISLAAYDPQKRAKMPSRPCSLQQAEWFFRKLGVKPVEGFKTRLVRHFVVVTGQTQ